MAARKHDEGHRQASWLDLFFDLSFVVAVARAAVELEHAFARVTRVPASSPISWSSPRSGGRG